MMIALEKLLHLPVETETGTKLGTIVSVVIDIETHGVQHYIVKPSFLPRLLSQELMISPHQVLAIKEEKMIVEDAILKDPATAPTPAV